MKLSIFPEVLAHPKTTEEKRIAAIKTGRPNKPIIVEVKNENELYEVISKYAWSPSIFKEFRTREDFKSADFIGLDIDDGLSMEECYSRCVSHGITALGLPSPSYSIDKEKFRLIIPLSKTIINSEDFKNTWEALFKIFPELDKACCDNSRFFFACKQGFEEQGFFVEANLFEPVQIDYVNLPTNYSTITKKVEVNKNIEELVYEIYKTERKFIPESVDYFIKNAGDGLEGELWSATNRFAYSLSLQGFDQCDIINLTFKFIAPYRVETRKEKILKCIERACMDGLRDRSDL